MQKDKVFQLRLSADERKTIEERMAKIGVKNFSAYLRKMALNGYYIVLDLSDVKELLRLLRICSNNLNQYAKKANETDSIYKADIEDLKKRQDEFWEMTRDILSRLSSILTRRETSGSYKINCTSCK